MLFLNQLLGVTGSDADLLSGNERIRQTRTYIRQEGRLIEIPRTDAR